MALRDWQLALGQLVEARAAGRDHAPAPALLAGLELSGAERTWLEEVTATPGFALTSFVPRWWRDTRVARSARLTLAALGAEAAARLDDYRRAVPNFTLFFVPEGIAFTEYVETLAVPAVVHAVARFERAMWNVRLGVPVAASTAAAEAGAPGSPSLEPGAALDDEPLVRHPAAAVIAFEAAPDQVLAALLQGQPLPDPDAEPHHALVAPGLPGRWRSASSAEALAFRACEPARTPRALRALPHGRPEAVDSLWAARALVRAAPPAG
jgi:hypothetical protein